MGSVSEVKGRGFILLAALLWSTGGVGIKLSGLGAWGVASGRSFFAALFLFLVIKQARRAPNRAVWPAAIAYAATVITFVLATKATTAANAIFLQDTAPLYVLLLSPWLLGERLTRSELLSVPVFALGMALFFVDQLS